MSPASVHPDAPALLRCCPPLLPHAKVTLVKVPKTPVFLQGQESPAHLGQGLPSEVLPGPHITRPRGSNRFHMRPLVNQAARRMTVGQRGGHLQNTDRCVIERNPAFVLQRGNKSGAGKDFSAKDPFGGHHRLTPGRNATPSP